MKDQGISKNYLAVEARDLHNATSSAPLRERWSEVSPTKAVYLQNIYDAFNQPLLIDEIKPVGPLTEAIDNGTLWVAFTGGKDCLAAALVARDQGHNVILYHVQGINRTWPNERDYAEAAAKAMGFPLLVDRISIVGRKYGGMISLPTRNQVIESLMISRMVERGGSHWALGLHSIDTPDQCQPTMTWSDSTTTNTQWSAHLDTLVLGLHFHCFLRGDLHSLAILAEKGYLAYAHGCVSQPRLQNLFRTSAIRRFGNCILPGRCGTCTKCWAEYLMLVHLGVLPKTGYYDHCLASMSNVEKQGRVHTWVGDPLTNYIHQDILDMYKGVSWTDPHAMVKVTPETPDLPGVIRSLPEVTMRHSREVPVEKLLGIG
jgi:hypothetical protein